MTKRRVRLGIGLDWQKLADTIQQAFDTFEKLPGLSVDAHQVANGWLHLIPKSGHDAEGNLTRVIGWLLTFGYPHGEEPLKELAGLSGLRAEGIKLAGWEPGLYASFWLPPEMPSQEIAALAITLVREVQLVPDDAHVEIALEYET